MPEIAVTGKVMTIKVLDSQMRRLIAVDLGRADSLAVSLELNKDDGGRATVGLRTGGRLSDPVMLGIFEGEDVRHADNLYNGVAEAMEKASRRKIGATSVARAFAFGAASCVVLFVVLAAGVGFGVSKSAANSIPTPVAARASAQAAAAAPPAFQAAQPFAPPTGQPQAAPMPQLMQLPRGTVVDADDVLPDDGPTDQQR